MSDPIFDPAYWRARLAECGGELHRAMFQGSADQMAAVEVVQRRQLAREIGPAEAVLDAGCGYGRLLGLMPPTWGGDYVGVDSCPEFITMAKLLWPGRRFYVNDLRNLPWPAPIFDVAVCCGIKVMVGANVGAAAWAIIEAELTRVADRLVVIDAPPFN